MIWLTWRQFRASAAMAAAALAAVLAVSGPGLADDYSSPTSSPAGKKVRPRRDDIASRLPQPVSGHQSAPEKRTMIHAGDRLENPITGEALVVAAARRTRPRGTDGKALGYREIVPAWQQ
jgi:hypothetical protein